MSPSFAQLGAPDPICRALAARGITEPFEIQAATIADGLAGRDVCGRAPTGSGKTIAFGIPLVVTVERARPRRPSALVLAPTRELAAQIAAELRTFAGDVRVDAVYGGVGYGPQLQALRRGVDILVACPGRLEDLVDRGDIDLADVTAVVVDEADRMADMGFLPAVRRILAQTADDRQTLLFSATLDGEVAALTRDYQRDPVQHLLGEDRPDITAAEHLFWSTDKAGRVDACAEAIAAASPAIVFCRTRHGADRLARQLADRGIKAGAIHGGRNQSQRARALELFIAGRLDALVATDVAARGIHVDGVAAVIHHDPPADDTTYVHRSGRTARAGSGGIVLTLVTGDQRSDVRRIQRRVGLDEGVTAPDPELMRELVAGGRLAGRIAEQSDARQAATPLSVELADGRPRRKPRTGGRRPVPARTGDGGKPRTGGGHERTGRPPRSGDGRPGGPKGPRRNGARTAGPVRAGGGSNGSNGSGGSRTGPAANQGRPGPRPAGARRGRR